MNDGRQGRLRPLREACLDEAARIIGEKGIEALSLREVARRLGVSHQAPYKHFADRDQIVAEVVARAFRDFTIHLQRCKHHADPLKELANLGELYLKFARQNPLHYRLMFGTPLPDAACHPGMMQQAREPFDILRRVIARLPGRNSAAEIDRDAMFVWATVHGLASILETRAGEELGLHPRDLTELTTHTLRRIGAAMRDG